MARGMGSTASRASISDFRSVPFEGRQDTSRCVLRQVGTSRCHQVFQPVCTPLIACSLFIDGILNKAQNCSARNAVWVWNLASQWEEHRLGHGAEGNI
jgi:hypothetical protein